MANHLKMADVQAILALVACGRSSGGSVGTRGWTTRRRQSEEVPDLFHPFIEGK